MARLLAPIALALELLISAVVIATTIVVDAGFTVLRLVTGLATFSALERKASWYIGVQSFFTFV